MVVPNVAYATQSATSALAPWNYSVRDPLEDEVLIKVKFCGVCHSDVHLAKNDWGFSPYPMVPGHEFTGVVVKAGAKCKKYKVGDIVGVGCIVDSCRDCEECRNDTEQFCAKACDTYCGTTRGERTYGGYGKYVVCREEYVLRIPSNLPLDQAAPLLCAGITVYSPIMANKMDRGGLKIAVIGLGGLGHMAVQFAAAFNNEVYVISRTAKKEELAKKLGAKQMLLSSDPEQMKAHNRSFHYVIDTVAAEKPMDDYLALLKPKGVLVTVGLPPVTTRLAIRPFALIGGNRAIQGSQIGGMKETQEMLDLCGKRMILPMIEKVPCSYINQAFERVMKSDVMFRFVLDVEATVPELANAPF